VTAAQRLAAQVDRAVTDGAVLVSEGERNGAFFPPGVLTNVATSSPSYKEELFGPVATVYKVDSEDEAVELANDTPFGLGSYVFTTDLAQAERVADKIDAGMVFVNVVGADGVELPFGGIKRSGFGRELGSFGIDEFVNKKLLRFVEPAVAPARPFTFDGFQGFATALSSSALSPRTIASSSSWCSSAIS